MELISTKASSNDFRDYYSRQVVRGKPRMKALFSTIGKLAEITYHCLKVGELYQYQGKYGTTSTPHNRGAVLDKCLQPSIPTSSTTF